MIHKVPQGSSGNKIELAVANTSNHVTRHVRVEVQSPPSWIQFERPVVTIDEIPAGNEGVAVFTFSVGQTVPAGTEHTLQFVIRSEQNEKWTKEIQIAIVEQTIFVMLLTKLRQWAGEEAK